MELSRRTLLKLVTAGGAAGYAMRGQAFADVLGLPNSSFQFGVASGDPLPGGFIIWTRVTPEPAATPGSGLGSPTAVRWIIATDAALSNQIATGTVTTDAASDHTVKVDVGALSPATEYHYGFEIVTSGERSPIGVAKTAPAAQASVAQLTFALVSCSNYDAGYFAPYRYLATRCLDFVVHVGDYTYEYGPDTYGSGSAHGRIVDRRTRRSRSRTTDVAKRSTRPTPTCRHCTPVVRGSPRSTTTRRPTTPTWPAPRTTNRAPRAPTSTAGMRRTRRTSSGCPSARRRRSRRAVCSCIAPSASALWPN